MSTGRGAPFGGTIDKTVAGSKPWWPQETKPPQGAPNILVVLFDDVGFSDFGCYGSSHKTAKIHSLAGRGLRCPGFHTPPICSTPGAPPMTGRTPHSLAGRCLADFHSGLSGHHSHRP